VIVAPPTHPLVGKPRIPGPRLAREPFVVREKGIGHLELDAGRLRRASWSTQHRDGDPSTETIKQAVMAGMGVSFLSAHTISRELKSGSLCVLDVQGFPLMLNWYVVHRRTKRLPPVAQAFKDFLLSDGASCRSNRWSHDNRRPEKTKERWKRSLSLGRGTIDQLVSALRMLLRCCTSAARAALYMITMGIAATRSRRASSLVADCGAVRIARESRVVLLMEMLLRS
jgi:hypothetical protein